MELDWWHVWVELIGWESGVGGTYVSLLQFTLKHVESSVLSVWGTSSCLSSSSSFLGLSRAPCSRGPGLGDISGWNSTSNTVEEVRAAGRKLRKVSYTTVDTNLGYFHVA